MRVLHVLAERGFSGGEVQLEHLVRHLAAAGHQQLLALVPRAEFARVGRELDIPISVVNLRGGPSPVAAWKLRRAVRRFAPDVLHFGCGRSLLLGGLFAVGVRVPLRITTRRIDYPISKSVFHGGRYRHFVDHVVANCLAVQQRVLDAGVPTSRVTVVHEGIDVAPWLGLLEHREAARARLRIDPEVLVVSCAATLRPRKGQRVLIDAIAGLERDDVRLILAGSGSDRDALRQHADALGLGGRVQLPGPVRPVSDLYAATDIAVMPSFHEGLSNACLEASAAGLPLIVSAVGGLTEIVEDGVTGAIVPPGDVEALRLALARYLADAGMRRAAGAAGSVRTRGRFTHDRMARGMEELFSRLLDDVRLSRSQA